MVEAGRLGVVARAGGGELGRLRVALQTLHDTAAGRVYAAYGGIYIGVAIFWLRVIDGVRPTGWDIAGVLVALSGMGIIAFQPR